MLIVGARFLGAEGASACRTLGVEATVVEAARSILAPLSAEAGALCAVTIRVTRRRKLVGAVAFDMPRALAHARRLIEEQAMRTQAALVWGRE